MWMTVSVHFNFPNQPKRAPFWDTINVRNTTVFATRITSYWKQSTCIYISLTYQNSGRTILKIKMTGKLWF